METLKIIVGCERSQIVTNAFRNKGHEAFSCDILDSEYPSDHHIKGDILDVLKQKWDMMIVFPPCTHLCVSGARWFRYKKKEQRDALSFVKKLMNADIPKICVENPVGIISSKIRKPDQIVQPWQFGHDETKATCLWLKGLPKLKPTQIVM